MAFWDRSSPLSRLAGLAGRALVDALYPLECVGCGSSGKIICHACSVSITPLSAPFCRVCGTPGEFDRCRICTESVRNFEGVRAPYLYGGAVRRAILALKYGGIKAAAEPLGDMLGEYLDANPLPGDLLIPVPMHPRRRKERGYNQAELLARRVERICGLAYDDRALHRSRNVDPQAGMNSAALRVSNVLGSVAVKPGANVEGAGIILVDDVATTGNTLDTCAKELKEAGATSVWGLTLAIAGGQSLTE